VTSYAGYDPMGRVTASSQQTAGHVYSMSYDYDLAGNLTREIYPSVKYTPLAGLSNTAVFSSSRAQFSAVAGAIGRISLK
jgi:YD repeat-containing protein